MGLSKDRLRGMLQAKHKLSYGNRSPRLSKLHKGFRHRIGRFFILRKDTCSAADVLSQLGPLLRGHPPIRAIAPAQPRLPLGSALAPPLASAAIGPLGEEDGLDLIVEKLSPTPVAVDELVRQCQMSAASVATLLLELELAGRIERHPGNLVSLR